MGASGVQRPVKFIKYLPDFNWKPIVLTPQPGAYHTFDQSLLDEVNGEHIQIERVEGKTPFHVGGGDPKKINIPEKLAAILRSISHFFWIPDNKTGWIKPALKKARQIINSPDSDIDLIYSTAPPYSNHLIAAQLKKEFGLPVVMDLRDEWLHSPLISYPTRFHRRKMARIEKKTLTAADLVTVINDHTRKSVAARLNDVTEVKEISHGFDPADFSFSTEPATKNPQKLSLLYSGIFYGERQPDTFLKAVRLAMEEQPELRSVIDLQFQGGLNKEHLTMIDQLDLQNNITNFGYIPHKKAVQNLMKADILWFIIGHKTHSDKVTAGKIFEYFGTSKPILALLPEGSGKRLLTDYGSSYIAPPYNVKQIKNRVITVYQDWKNGTIPAANQSFIARYNRKNITQELSKEFERLVEENESKISR